VRNYRFEGKCSCRGGSARIASVRSALFRRGAVRRLDQKNSGVGQQCRFSSGGHPDTDSHIVSMPCSCSICMTGAISREILNTPTIRFSMIDETTRTRGAVAFRNQQRSKRKLLIHNLLGVIANEVCEFIRECEWDHEDRWVPAAYIKNSLELNFIAVPRENVQYGEKGWLFAILVRKLEDGGLVEYKKESGRAFYRTLEG